jgi:hypothetical protein
VGAVHIIELKAKEDQGCRQSWKYPPLATKYTGSQFQVLLPPSPPQVDEESKTPFASVAD